MADVVVITGGSAGIGRAAARQFATRGCAVGLIARGQERLDSARAELEILGAKVHTVSADVADAEAVERAAAEIEGALGPITIWVNNAMATIYSPIRQASAEEIKRVTEVTYLGSVNGTLTALKRMRGRGTVVQVSSVLSWRAIPIQGPYCGAKFALRGFTESLRAELIHEGSKVHLTMVHLPAVNTPQFDWARNRTGHRAKAPDPIYQPEMAARAIVFAAFNQRRDVWMGRGTVAAILAGRLAPSLVDQALARQAGGGQMGEPHADQDGNLFEPVPGDQAARGRFSERAKDTQEIYTSRQADVLAAGVLLIGAIGIKALLLSPLAGARRIRSLPALAAGRAVLPRRLG